MHNRHQRLILAATVAVILLGVAIRLQGFAPTLSMLHHDEAWNGWRAATLLDNPRLVLFYPDNTGHESGFTYWLALFVGAFGATTLALRLAVLFIHVLTLAVAARLGRQLFGAWGGVMLAGALAVLYWHVHFSHVVFRANLMPFAVIAALGAWLSAIEHPTRRRWLIAGGAIGLIAYTYTAGHGWIALFGLMTALAVFVGRVRWRDGLLSMALAVALAVPAWVSILLPRGDDGGLGRTSINTVNDFVVNVQAWLGAWFSAGDPYYMHNYSNRPVFDLPLGILAILGLIGFWWVVRRRWMMALLIGGAAVGIFPALVTLDPPHFLRAIGLIIPVIILIAAGLLTLTRRLPSPFGAVIAAGLLLWAGVDSAAVFPQWLADGNRLALYIDDRVGGALDVVIEQTPPAMPIYIPGLAFHPVAAYRAFDLPARDVVFYDFPDGDCFLTPREPVAFMDLPIVLNSFRSRLAPYATFDVIAEHPKAHYNVIIAEPIADLVDDWPDAAQIGAIRARSIGQLSATLTTGDALNFDIAMRISAPVTVPYRWLVHLIDTDGALIATGDEPLCTVALSPLRHDGETVVQPVSVTLPSDVDAGTYRVMIGLYHPETGERLPVTLADGTQTDQVEAVSVQVE